MMSRQRPIIIFILIALLSLLSARQGKQKTNRNTAQHQLKEVRKALSQLTAALKKSRSSLQVHLDSLQYLDQQIRLEKRALSLLKQEQSIQRRRLHSLNTRMDSLQQHREKLKKIFSRQLVFIYKYQQGKELEWLLGAKNFNQAFLRYRYFQSVTRNVQRSITHLREQQSRLDTLKEKHARTFAYKQRLLEEAGREQRLLKQKRSERKRVIKKITQNKSLLEIALRAKKASYRQLKKHIASIETKRISEEVRSPQQQQQWNKAKGRFARQKGKLNWPVSGKVVHKFGRQINPQLKTVLINHGVDIKAAKGASVRSIFSGTVSLITYMSGFGNTVIIDHRNGYYTVFSHLDRVSVSKFQSLEAGTIIGTVGDSGSLEGALLHFEIYGENKPLNPLHWLRR